MGKDYLEKSLKRFLKGKVKITLGLVVTFMITGTAAFAEFTADGDVLTGNETLESYKSADFDGKNLSDYKEIHITVSNVSGLKTWSGRYDLPDTDLYITVTGTTSNSDGIHLTNWDPHIILNKYVADIDAPKSDALNLSHDATTPYATINELDITVKQAHGIRANSSLYDVNTKITINKKADIKIYGKNAVAAYAGDDEKYFFSLGAESKGFGQIYLNGKTTINAYGDNSKGIWAGKNGLIEVGDLELEASGNNSIGISATNGNITWNGLDNSSNKWGSTVILTGDEVKVNVPLGKAFNAESEYGKIYSKDNKKILFDIGGNIEAKDKGTINLQTLAGSQVKGNLVTEKNGTIDINFDSENSKLTGNSSLGNNSDGIINLGLTDNAVWENTDDSAVTNFNLNSGIVKMDYAENGQDLTIKNMEGNNGTFIIDISSDDIDHIGDKTDFINVEKADTAQTHFIQTNENSINGLINYDFENKSPNKAIWFADTAENVTFEGKEFESISNVYDYTLEFDTNLRDTDTSVNGTNWYISGLEKKENEMTETVIDDLSFLYNAALSRLEIDTLHKRMGEIRNYENTNGVWFRTSGGKQKSDIINSEFKNDYYMLQVGYDKKKESEKGKWFTGFAVSRRESDIDFRNGNGESENIGISLYKSFAGKDNSYFDLIGRYTFIDTEYKAFNNTSMMKADYDTWAGTLSAEYGKKYSSDSWYVTPHAQINYTYIDGESYKTSSGVKVSQDNIDSLIGRAGVYAGKDFEKSSHYLKASVLHEFMGDYGAEIKGADASIHKKLNGEDTWFEVGIGGNFQIGESGTTHIYYDLERTFESDFETEWQATVGIRLSFDKLSDLFKAPAIR